MTFKRATVLVTPVVIALVIAGCSTSTPTPPPAPRAAPPVVRSIAVSPAQYMAAAASSSLLIIRASELIAARGSGALGSRASRFKAEQEGIGAQLSLAGRRLDLLPSAILLPRHQAMLDDIAASADPGAAYARHLQTLLPQALALHRQYERYGTSPTLRPVAAMAAPILERELKELRRR